MKYVSSIKLREGKVAELIDRLSHELGIPKVRIVEDLIESIIKGRVIPIELLENPLIICKWVSNAKAMLENWLVDNPQDNKLIREKLVKIKLIYDVLKEANICM